MPRPLDNTLASNVGTGLLLPRLDQTIGHGAKYLLQQLGATAAEGLAALGRRSPAPDLTPRQVRHPGNAAPMTAVSQEVSVRSRMETLTCGETGRAHPVLPRDQCAKMASYMDAVNTAGLPASNRLPDGQHDAFTTKVETPEGSLDLLPTSLTTSVLLNRKLRTQITNDCKSQGQSIADLKTAMTETQKQIADAMKEDTQGWSADEIAEHIQDIGRLEKNVDYLRQRIAALDGTLPTMKGQLQSHYVNSLYDPLTGFAASIAVRDDREVVVNFSGMGSQGAGLRQFFRCAANILGLTPPKNFSQASQLTQIVKAHLEELNAKLPPGQPKYRLKLAGHSMGGGMATYAALRNDVEAVVFNPLRLGLMTRAKVGRPALKNAPRLVTEVVVKTDWVADNRGSWLYGLLHVPSILLTGRRADAWGAIGNRYLVPKPDGDQLETYARENGWWSGLDTDAREKAIQDWAAGFSVHAGIARAIQIHEQTPDPNAPPPAPSAPRAGRLLA